ncbi:MAG: MotA/TolQ/ExbB proton channel family protein [Deltaproteobacteria bacterium]|nr:MotA/TolQ/ExbB proton channel family protein [Deltaproteobacteria bacterium]
MVAIIACSILSIAVAVERTIALWSVGSDARNLGELISRHLFRGDIEEARKACERSRSIAADIFLAGFSRHGRTSFDAVASAVERERQQVGLKLRSHVWILGTIGATAPFVGLFGTVWGILHSFHQMAATGQGGFAVVAGGISEALVTTAGGILVAVEAVVLYNFFQTRLSRTGVELKLAADEFLELLKERPNLAAAAGAPLPTAEQKPASA